MTDNGCPEELRAEFRRGATFAGLIQHARKFSTSGTARHDWATAVRKAFHLSLHGWGLLDLTDSFGCGQHRDEILTSFHLGMILQNRPLWDCPTAQRHRAWYDAIAWVELEPPCVFRETTAADLAALAEQLQRRASGTHAPPMAEHRTTASAA